MKCNSEFILRLDVIINEQSLNNNSIDERNIKTLFHNIFVLDSIFTKFINSKTAWHKPVSTFNSLIARSFQNGLLIANNDNNFR